MENFLINVEKDEVTGIFVACYLNGDDVVLEAATYEDAVLEADLAQ